ncbi:MULTISPECIES: DUF2237 family protein [Candidatus Ichthyocystis]|uniref:DUF2237 family protein n=1 Tax=Candidatus Ichthyocystis TaxID=2929841 RepID=UPI000B826A59|nr:MULTISPECIES: DUF2237 family protein [Ichthyocystis]
MSCISIGEKNVLGGALESCCFFPRAVGSSGGFCRSISGDSDNEPLVCALISEDFFSFLRSNIPDFCDSSEIYVDLWCCIPVSIWKKAFDANVAPLVNLTATHESVLSVVSINSLLSKRYAIWNDKATPKSSTT